LPISGQYILLKLSVSNSDRVLKNIN